MLKGRHILKLPSIYSNPYRAATNRHFVLPFENDNGREGHKQHYLSTVEIKVYNVMIDGRNFFYQPIKSNLKTYDNIRKIEIV